MSNFTAPGTNGITELFYGDALKLKVYLVEGGHGAVFS